VGVPCREGRPVFFPFLFPFSSCLFLSFFFFIFFLTARSRLGRLRVGLRRIRILGRQSSVECSRLHLGPLARVGSGLDDVTCPLSFPVLFPAVIHGQVSSLPVFFILDVFGLCHICFFIV
jgi:hypothetical protein